MATSTVAPSHDTEADLTTEQSTNSIVYLPDFEGDHHEGFWMPTRCWVQEYGPLLNLNEWRYYQFLALYYNKDQKRSFPKKEQLEAYCSIGAHEECDARRGLAMLGLVEWWREPVGQRHSWRFFRLPHVARNLRHFGTRKQPSAHELLELKSRDELPEGYEWVKSCGVKVLTPRVTAEDVADEIGRRMERWTSRRKR